MDFCLPSSEYDCNVTDDTAYIVIITGPREKKVYEGKFVYIPLKVYIGATYYLPHKQHGIVQ